MKPTKLNIHEIGGNDRALILIGVVAALAATFACPSNGSKRVENPSKPITSATVRPAALQTIEPAVAQPAPTPAAKKTSSSKPIPATKVMTYKSRDYGVSFDYPWQYEFASGRSLAKDSEKSDGDEGEFTLARVEIPKGYYPDTDFDSGYLALSLNQNVDEQGCQAQVTPAKDGKVETDTINGVEFRWVETDEGGHGSSARVRNYAAFTGGACYQVEMGVKTRNDRGMAREVNVDSVMSRLDGVLKTVEIAPALRDADASKGETSSPAPAAVSQN